MAQAQGLLALAAATTTTTTTHQQQLQAPGQGAASGAASEAQWVSSAIQYFSEALDLLAKDESDALVTPAVFKGGSGAVSSGVGGLGEGFGGSGAAAAAAAGGSGGGGVQGLDWWSGTAGDLSAASLQYGLLCYQMLQAAQASNVRVRSTQGKNRALITNEKTEDYNNIADCKDDCETIYAP
jgi:hypothetical protein